MNCSSLPGRAAALTLGRLTCTPCWMIGAVTMKMISSTSMTSTSGVTLICETSIPRGPDSVATMGSSPGGASSFSRQEVTFRDIQEFRNEIIHLDRQYAHSRRQEIVEHLRRDRRDESDRGRDQRLRDTRRDRLNIRRMSRRQPNKRCHYSPYRAEQPDKWRGRPGRRQKRNPLLKLGQFDIRLPLHRARDVFDPAQVGREAALCADRLTLRPRELEQFLIARAEHLRDRTIPQAHARRMNCREIFRFPEDRDKAFGLPARPRNLHELIDDNAPATDRKSHQRPQHYLDHWPGAEDQIHNAEAARAVHPLFPPPSIIRKLRSLFAPLPVESNLSELASSREGSSWLAAKVV